MKGGDFEIDAQSAAIGVGLSGKRADLCFFGDGAGEVVFGKEKVHLGIITRKEWAGLCGG